MFDIMASLLVPPLILAAQLLCLAFFTVAGLYLYSTGTLKPPTEDLVPVGSIELDDKTKYMLGFHVFAGFWNLAFLFALCEFLLASLVCMWYFREQRWSYLLTSMYRAFRYHLGSLAFGSLLIAILWAIRLLFEFIADKVKNLSQENTIARFIICCTRCCLDCFERFLSFLNRNAYIQIALTGKDFLEAGCDAFNLMVRNGVSFGITFGLGGIFNLLGRLFVTSASIVIGYLILTRDIELSKKITSPIIPCFFIGVIAFIVSYLMMAVYSVACEAILQCYLVDCEVATNNKETVKYCPEPLLKYYEEFQN
jgi:hypothetical protein